jgi:hypothetical protein
MSDKYQQNMKGLIMVMITNSERMTRFDSIREWCVNSDTKFCVTNVETGEILVADNVKSFKYQLQLMSEYVEIDNLYFYGYDKHGAEWLREYFLKCQKYHIRNVKCSNNKKLVECELCGDCISVSKHVINDGWVCNECCDALL